MFSDTFGIYLKGGVSKVTIDVTQSGTTSTFADKDVYGVATGIGAKKFFGENVFVKLEYMETDYASYSDVAMTTTTNSTVEADVDAEATRLSLGWNF
jgi:opacity protein-like surface antigen